MHHHIKTDYVHGVDAYDMPIGKAFSIIDYLTLNIETLRDDPTAKNLIHRLYPNEIADAEAKGVKKATSDFIRRLDGMLSKEQMEQVFGELPSQEEPKKST